MTSIHQWEPHGLRKVLTHTEPVPGLVTLWVREAVMASWVGKGFALKCPAEGGNPVWNPLFVRLNILKMGGECCRNAGWCGFKPQVLAISLEEIQLKIRKILLVGRWTLWKYAGHLGTIIPFWVGEIVWEHQPVAMSIGISLAAKSLQSVRAHVSSSTNLLEKDYLVSPWISHEPMLNPPSGMCTTVEACFMRFKKWCWWLFRKLKQHNVTYVT